MTHKAPLLHATPEALARAVLRPRPPADDGEHHDVRSEGPSGDKRFIEVKGRAQSGEISDQSREGQAAATRQTGLALVTYCKGEQSRLRIIQDPISKLTPEMPCRQVRYFVEEDDWSQRGEAFNALPPQGGQCP